LQRKIKNDAGKNINPTEEEFNLQNFNMQFYGFGNAAAVYDYRRTGYGRLQDVEYPSFYPDRADINRGYDGKIAG
jgi:hypothetical protein